MPDYSLKRPKINGRQTDIWYVTWSESGRSKRLSTGHKDKSAAKQWLEQYKAITEQPQSDASVDMILTAYMDERVDHGRNKSNLETSLKPLRAFFGAMTPNLITQGKIRAYEAYRGEKPASIERELKTLRAALNWALREGWSVFFTPFKIKASGSRRKRFLTQAEFSRLFSEADTVRMMLFLSIAIHTASRSKKIYELKWADIDPVAGIINFPEGTANKRTRPIPINKTLSWHLAIGMNFRTSPYVIERAGKPVRSLRKSFNDIAERAGVRDVQIHDLRRTAASWLLQRGASIELVAKFLDDSVEVVERHYGHFATGHIRGAADLLG